ncbi:multicopy suppressor of a budding defect [Saxophila tyrrhenica]|uniref:Multicopy suppressor of a budding defect n=1 Tax=Saxophila tyrrhenica TaxID=1690608 RepID=A0AAV9PFA2_9PEZI|nr:multicopy suppressor of a budding defect [Saxophila tyrrhenica]
MPGFLSKLKNKGAQPSSKGKHTPDLTNGKATEPHKPRWQTQWTSKTVVPEEVEELIHTCTAEMKSRAEALDAPFLLLPFRPATDASGARSFIRNFYRSNAEGSHQYRGSSLQQELRLTEPIVLCSIMKWCWSRMPDGVVGWSVYQGFQIGESESSLARNAFDEFIPLSADSTSRKNIIYDFYDLLAAVAAHGKTNGMGGRKLSRLAGWWAFDHSDDGKGFEGGYRSWAMAADASSHLFFAYLRSLSPEANPAMSLIERIPRSLQALLASTEYPPETPTLMQTPTPRVVMIVDSVSPTPFALLRRAKHFEFRDRDQVLREYSEFEDPVDALTEECKRVLYAISSTNSSVARSRHRNLTKTDESWSAFQNLGFGDMDEKALQKTPATLNGSAAKPQSGGLRSEPRSRNADHARPTTPSWADFLSSGFVEDDQNQTPTLLMPPDHMLPPLGSRAQTPSHIPEGDEIVAPGELAAITDINLDDAFWWVWMISLASEEPQERKAVFGRCAVIETSIMHGRWLIMEEQVKGASPDPQEGAYIAPKKSFFSFTKRGRLGRKRSTNKKPYDSEQPAERLTSATPSRTSLAPAQQSKIKQAAAALKRQDTKDDETATRRGRHDDPYASKTNSTLTMGLQTEAGPAMKWMGAYDKHTLRAQYLGDTYAGTGMSREDLLLRKTSSNNVIGDRTSTIPSPAPPASPSANNLPASYMERELPAVPPQERTVTSTTIPQEEQPSAPLPPASPELTATPARPEETQHDAENVPIPDIAAPTAMDKEMAVGPSTSPTRNRVSRKPVSQAHPAFRKQSVDQPTSPQTPTSPTNNLAAIAAVKAMQTSPESQKSGNAKLKKQNASGAPSGLKKMFGRNKKDMSNRQSMDVKQSNGLAPPDQGPMRRLSLMRKKPSQPPTPKDSRTNLSHHSDASELEAVPVMPAAHGQFDNHSSAAISTTESQDQRHADQEFARFDQGPADLPMTSPQQSPPEIVAPQAQRVANPRMDYHAGPESGYEAFETPLEQPEPEMQDDAQSEATMEELDEASPAEKDRWATIRENAARRAARASEEQSMQSRPSQSARTDDGETSGEESKLYFREDG